MSSLIGPLLWTTVVALTLRPLFRAGRAGFLIYVLTMTVNELPSIFLLIISVHIWFGWESRPSGVFGLVWLALWGFVVVALIWIQLRAGRTRPALEAALDNGLDRDWRAAIHPDLASTSRISTPWFAGIVRPFQRRMAGVERIRNLRYGPDPVHLLDLYRGPVPAGGRPVLIHFHEGGFVQGGKSRESVALLNQLAAHGWLCLSANYRLREHAAWPNPLVDAKRAIAWAREHAAEYQADADKVFLIGGSAGGHIAINAVTTTAQRRFQPGFEEADTTIAAAVSLYGYLGPRTHEAASSPSGTSAGSSTPIFIIQGLNDTGLSVPVSTVRKWVASLKENSAAAPVVYAEIPGAQHAFDLFASVRARTVANSIEAFLAWVRSARG